MGDQFNLKQELIYLNFFINLETDFNQVNSLFEIGRLISEYFFLKNNPIFVYNNVLSRMEFTNFNIYDINYHRNLFKISDFLNDRYYSICYKKINPFWPENSQISSSLVFDNNGYENLRKKQLHNNTTLWYDHM